MHMITKHQNFEFTKSLKTTNNKTEISIFSFENLFSDIIEKLQYIDRSTKIIFALKNAVLQTISEYEIQIKICIDSLNDFIISTKYVFCFAFLKTRKIVVSQHVVL